jgi:DNA-binding MarR family transcriptional regulator
MTPSGEDPELGVALAEPLLAEEREVLARVSDLGVDLEAMAVVANVWRAAQAARTTLERRVLRPGGLSWGGFSLLFNLWVAGPDRPMETRALAASMGCSRPSVSSLCDTLERAGFVQRGGDSADRRLVLVSLTDQGQKTIAGLFPAFNAGERDLVRTMTADERRTLAALLRRLLHSIRAEPTKDPA